MYYASDIEVFFLAHNRAEFLREALDCYLKQTVQGARLVILANAPTPAVLQVTQNYASKGIETIVLPPFSNVYQGIEYCQETASRPITVIAHDDDLIHPAYLETLLACYNQIPHLNIALSTMGDWNKQPFSAKYNRKLFLLDQSQFSAYIFIGKSFTFSSCSYKTAAFKQAPKPDFACYGKVSDVPFMLGVCHDGKAAVLQFPFVKYRIHAGQDSRTFANGPTARQWVALDLCHKKMMSHGNKKTQWAYLCNAYHRLRIGWRDWCLCEHDKMTFGQYLNLARKMGALSLQKHLLGFLLRGRLRQALLNALCPFTKIN